METAESVINDALEEILVNASEQPVEAVEFQTGLRYLNRMMAEWDVRGLPLGYTKVTTPSDPITVPDGAINGIIFNLALRLAHKFDMPIAGDLAGKAQSGLTAIRRIAQTVRPTNPPSTLPIGSGNEHDWHDNYHFYPTTQDEVTTEQDGSILLEANTNDDL